MRLVSMLDASKIVLNAGKSFDKLMLKFRPCEYAHIRFYVIFGVLKAKCNYKGNKTVVRLCVV